VRTAGSCASDLLGSRHTYHEQRWQPLGDGRWGRVVGRGGTGRSVGRSHDGKGKNVYIVVTRLLIWDRTGPFVLDCDRTGSFVLDHD
jgi:hypothetical protein